MKVPRVDLDTAIPRIILILLIAYTAIWFLLAIKYPLGTMIILCRNTSVPASISDAATPLLFFVLSVRAFRKLDSTRRTRLIPITGQPAETPPDSN